MMKEFRLEFLLLVFCALIVSLWAQTSTISPVSTTGGNVSVATTAIPSCPDPVQRNINTSLGISVSVESENPLQTPNCTWTLEINRKGYFQLVELINNNPVILWTSESMQPIKKTEESSRPYKLELTVAGNLRFEDDQSEILWESDTPNEGDRPYLLNIEDDGNVIVYDDNDDQMWSLYCESMKPFMSSLDELGSGESIYSSLCAHRLILVNYTIELRHYKKWTNYSMIPSEDAKYVVKYKYPNNEINITGFIEPFVLSIDEDGTLGVKDASNSFLWRLSKKYRKSGAAPYYLRVENNDDIAIYDSLNQLIWDNNITRRARHPITEIFEILVLIGYFGGMVGFMCTNLFRVAYLTRNDKDYVRDSESGAMHYTQRSEIRTKLAESMKRGGENGRFSMSNISTGSAGEIGRTSTYKSDVDTLLLGPNSNEPQGDKLLQTNEQKDNDDEDSEIATDDEADENENEKDKTRPSATSSAVNALTAQMKREDTRKRLDEAFERQKRFKFGSIGHWKRFFYMLVLFSDLIFMSILHFACNATTYGIFVRWYLANFVAGFKWRPETITNLEFLYCFYILVGILGLYHVNSAISLRLEYRNTFYGLANKREVTYVEETTMRNVFVQQFFDIRILREVRSSLRSKQASQFFESIKQIKYAVSCVPQSILFVFYIMSVENYEQSWLVIASLGCQLLYILINNIQNDGEVFAPKANQKWPPTPGYLARSLFRLFELIMRVSTFALFSVVVHWTGVALLVLYHLFVNFIYYASSLLGKDKWNIVYFLLTISDLGLISRRRELDGWVTSKILKTLVHWSRAATCFVFSSSIDSILHCIRLDEQLLFDFIFGRFFETLTEIGIIYYLAEYFNDGVLPPTSQEGVLTFIAFVSAVAFVLLFIILKLANQFDQNRSAHRNALDLARDGRWSMLSDYIAFYREDEINRQDRFGDRTNILIYSAEQGKTSIVLQLLDTECDTSLTDRRGNTALHKAAKNGDIEILEALIDAGSNVNQQNYRGWTPLHVACKERHLDCVEKLVKSGSLPLMKMNEHLTCIGVAFRFGSLSIVKYLLSKINILHYNDMSLNMAMEYVQDCEDFGGPVVHALHYKELSLAKLLLECRVQSVNSQDHFGETALHKACSWGFKEVAQELIDTYKCDVDVISDKGYSPFHIAVARQYPEIVDLLVEEGAQINFPTVAFAEKILLKTCVKGHYNIFEILINNVKQINVNVRDLNGNSALLLAAQNKNIDICKKLIELGCDARLRNMWGKSVLDTKIPDDLRKTIDDVINAQSFDNKNNGDGDNDVANDMNDDEKDNNDDNDNPDDNIKNENNDDENENDADNA